MRHLALILSAAVLGTGCIVTSEDPFGDAVVYWSFSSDRLGAIGGSFDDAAAACALAGVHEVDIALQAPDGVWLEPETFPCSPTNNVPGITFPGLAEGTWGYELIAYRNVNGTAIAVYDTAGTFFVDDDERTFVDTQAGALYWDLELDYTVPSCTNVAAIDFELYSGSTLYFSSIYGPNPAIDWACSTASEASYVVLPSIPSGGYTVRYVSAVNAQGNVVYEGACGVGVAVPSDRSVILTTGLAAGVTCP